jgi:translation initiation factor IF-1
MRNREHIILDARLVDVIGLSGFRAELRNGHGLIAYRRRNAGDAGRRYGVGDTVRVEMSPCDMSKGWFVEED